jgi:hypothetical protein
MFQLYNEPAEALKDIKKLHLGDSSITEHKLQIPFTCVPDRDKGFSGLNRFIPRNATLGPAKPDHPI